MTASHLTPQVVSAWPLSTVLHYLCAGYQRFFRHIDEPMRVMADLLRRGGDAAGVRRWYADRDVTDRQPTSQSSD